MLGSIVLFVVVDGVAGAGGRVVFCCSAVMLGVVVAVGKLVVILLRD